MPEMPKMIDVKSYCEDCPPEFTIYGVKLENAPDDEFEAKVKLKVVNQSTPLEGEPCVRFAVTDLQSDAIDMQKADVSPHMDSGDMLGMAMEKAMMDKAGYKDGEED